MLIQIFNKLQLHAKHYAICCVQKDEKIVPTYEKPTIKLKRQVLKRKQNI